MGAGQTDNGDQNEKGGRHGTGHTENDRMAQKELFQKVVGFIEFVDERFKVEPDIHLVFDRSHFFQERTSVPTR